MLLLYPSLSTSVFALFVCSTVPDVEGAWLSEDWRVQCYEGSHATVYMPMGVFAGIVYIIGTPAVLFWRLWSNRHILHDPSSPNYNAIHFELGGLYQSFEKPFWFFEILVIVWKCFMTGALCIVAPNTAAQPLMATLFQLIFACLVLKLSPFKNDYDDIASFVSAASITLILLIASAIFANSKVPEEDKLYDEAGLEATLLVLTVGSFVAQLAIMVRVSFCSGALPPSCYCKSCRRMVRQRLKHPWVGDIVEEHSVDANIEILEGIPNPMKGSQVTSL